MSRDGFIPAPLNEGSATGFLVSTLKPFTSETLLANACYVCGETKWHPKSLESEFTRLGVIHAVEFFCMGCGTEYRIKVRV